MSIYTLSRVILRVDKMLLQNVLRPRLQQHKAVIGFCFVAGRPLHLSHCLSAVANQKHVDTGEGIFKRTWNSIKHHTVDKPRRRAQAFLLYETVADRIPYLLFFKEMNLPDTFNSWFLITELHVWMLMVKAMELGLEGRQVRNSIVEAMWTDVALKGKKLGVENASATGEQIHVLGDQFRAALLAYDEGLLSDDKVLAAAVWRRFFERNCDDPEKVETMVKYIRQQMHNLDNMSADDFRARKVFWLPLEKT